MLASGYRIRFGDQPRGDSTTEAYNPCKSPASELFQLGEVRVAYL